MEHKSHVALWLVSAGALVGAILTTWLAPMLISWYFNPPAQFGFSCAAPIEWALSRLRWAQFGGVLFGGILGAILFFTWLKRQRSQ